MERVRREEPEALLKMAEEEIGGGGLRGRSYRPQSMRRDVVKPAFPAAAAVAGAVPPPLEVDEGVQDVDGQEAAPKLVYNKSTRMMA
jgi:hypothetical protein